MKTFKFNTNINCSGCIAKVTPFLNAKKEIVEWNVDTTNPKKVLTITTNNFDQDEINTLINEAGFKSESL